MRAGASAPRHNPREVKPLHPGDLNGDGWGDAADYNSIDNAMARQSRGESFVNCGQIGELNGDGKLDGTDYNCLDNAEGK